MSPIAPRPDFAHVPLGLIAPPLLPARSMMNDAKLAELVESIRTIGIYQPLMLARDGARYEVVAGHRRWTAANTLKLAVVPAMIYPTKDDALEAIKVSENLDRESLNAADEAIYYSELLERKCGGDTNRLADLVKRKRAYVEGRLLLFQGDPKIFAALQAGDIKIGVAHQLNRCPDELHRRMLLYHAVHDGVTASVAEGWISQWQQQTAGGLVAAAALGDATPPAPVMASNYFICYVCGKSDHVHLMQPVNIHGHCRLAILDPLLGKDAPAGAATL